MMTVDAVTRARWNNECKYEEHYIALLDIMGFSKLVNDCSHNSTFVGILGSVIRLAEFTQVKTAIISDTIVISSLATNKTALTDVLACVSALYKTFIKEKILLRGAICRGALYHSGNIVFGPAMVAAHEAEETIAIYPRLILLPNLQDNFFTNYPEDEEEFFTDFDGIRCFDWISQVIFHSKLPDKQERLICIQELVQTYTNNSAVPARIQQKYLWLREHFNDSLSLLRQLDKANDFDYDKWIIH